ncbi:MAG TPA: hypothetical protein PKH69_09015 [Thiobacillaceae bacterium]|nr:hypothetical protein [Thiobacillaceae bacterium]HNU64490.1 hypothetical protein [Thiobacillaceae bacterium]
MFPLPLVITVGPSTRLRLLLTGLHLLAAMALWLAALPLALQTSGSLLLALGLARHLRGAHGVTLRGNEKGQLEIRAGQTWHALHDTRVHLLSPGLTLLRFENPGNARARNLLVLPDSMPAEDYRRLRVWLQWKYKDMTERDNAHWDHPRPGRRYANWRKV